MCVCCVCMYVCVLSMGSHLVTVERLAVIKEWDHSNEDVSNFKYSQCKYNLGLQKLLLFYMVWMKTFRIQQ